MNKYHQQPSEVIDYLIDLTVWVPENDSVVNTVASVVHAGHDQDGPVELAVYVTDSATRRPKVFCSRGVDGVEYKVTVLVTTAAGRVKEIDFKIKVEEQ